MSAIGSFAKGLLFVRLEGAQCISEALGEDQNHLDKLRSARRFSPTHQSDFHIALLCSIASLVTSPRYLKPRGSPHSTGPNLQPAHSSAPRSPC